MPSFVLDEVVTARLDGLAPDSARATELLAVAEHLALDHAERGIGTDVLDDLDRAGLLDVRTQGGREVVALSHPVYGEVLRSRLGGLAVRRHSRALAAALGPPGDLGDIDRLRLARWLLAAGDPVDPDLATTAGRLALGTHDVDLAERLARRAWENQPTAVAGNLLAEVLHTRGDLKGADGVLREAHRLSHDEREAARTLALEALTHLHGSGDPAAALATVRTGRGAGMVDREARLALFVAELYVLLMSESFGQLDAAVAALEAETPAHTTVASRQLVSGAHIIRGRLDAASALVTTPVLLADDLFVRSQDLELMAGGVHAMAVLRSGRLAEAEAVARANHQRCVAAGDPRSRSMSACALAMIELLHGDAAAARRWATDATVALDGAFAPNLACLAHAVALSAAVVLGDRDAAEPVLAALAELDATSERLYAAWSVRARAAAAAGLDGEAGRAAGMLLDAARRYQANLQRVYVKLGVAGRRGLAEAADALCLPAATGTRPPS